MAHSGYHVFQIVNLATGESKTSIRIPRGIAKNLNFRVDIIKTFPTHEERTAYLRSIRPPNPELAAKRLAAITKAAAVSKVVNAGRHKEWASRGGKARAKRHGLGRMAEFAPYARYGTKHTEEAKAKISAGNKGKGRYHKRDKGKSS